MPQVDASPENLPDVDKILKGHKLTVIAGFKVDICAPDVDPNDPKLSKAIEKVMGLLEADGIKPIEGTSVIITPSQSGGLRLSFNVSGNSDVISTELKDPGERSSVGWRRS